MASLGFARKGLLVASGRSSGEAPIKKLGLEGTIAKIAQVQFAGVAPVRVLVTKLASASGQEILGWLTPPSLLFAQRNAISSAHASESSAH